MLEVDPVTKVPSYRHVQSGEVRSEAPADYERYLALFHRYLKMNPKTASCFTPAFASTESHLQREKPCKRDHNAGLISYSSSSEDEVDCETERRTDVAIDGHKQLSQNEDSIVEEASFIGPQLPPGHVLLSKALVIEAADNSDEHRNAVDIRVIPVSDNRILHKKVSFICWDLNLKLKMVQLGFHFRDIMTMCSKYNRLGY